MPNYGTTNRRVRAFWDKVDKTNGPDACWPWKASDNGKGYGQVGGVLGRTHGKGAAQVAYGLTHGPVPKGLCVLHHCDNPPCCNPKHLFLGTKGDNRKDCVSKNRHNFGERNGSAKMTTDDVRKLLRLRKRGWTCPRLAERFGISETQAESIVKRRNWKHL